MLPSKSDYWIIWGQEYDLRDYVRAHPGGVAIRAAQGQDATELIEQIHPFSIAQVKRILKRYQVDQQSIEKKVGESDRQCSPSIIGGAYLDFLLAFEKKLAEQGLSYQDICNNNPQGWLYIGCCTVVYYALLIAALTSSVSSWHFYLIPPLLGLALAIHAQYLIHEGSHCAITKRRSLNLCLATYGSALICYRDFLDDHLVHHSHTNHLEHDKDLSNLTHVFYLSEASSAHYLHRWQHWLFFLAAPIWALMISVMRILLSLGGRPRRKDFTVLHQCIFYSVTGATIFILHVLPFLLHGLTPEALYLAVVPRVVSWIFIVNVFQWNHFYDSGAQGLGFYDAGESPEIGYFEHVLATTNNVNEGSRITQYLLAGQQIQHHLLPLVSASNTHLLLETTHEIAKKYGLRYSNTPSIWVQLKNNFAFYKRMAAESERVWLEEKLKEESLTMSG